MNKEELRNYRRMEVELERLGGKMAELRRRAESPGSPALTGMPRGGERRDFTDLLDELVGLQERYSERAKAAIAEQARVEDAIAALADPVERAVLGYRYVDGLTWEQICVKISYGWAQTHRVHASALINIDQIREG